MSGDPRPSGRGRVAERVAIVTGAGSGLGRAISQRLAAEGARVVCADVDTDAVEDTAGGIPGALALTADVTSSRDVEEMTATAARVLGGVDLVVANAGIAGPGSADDLDERTWDRVIGVNLTGVWLTAKHAIPFLRERGGGAIVTIASIAALMGIPGMAAYAAAKGGVVALTRQMAADLAPDGIRANAICPGTVPTPLVLDTLRDSPGLSGAGGSAEKRLETLAGRYPLRRVGTTADVAGAVVYLGSDEGAWITGTVLRVDGGMTSLART